MHICCKIYDFPPNMKTNYLSCLYKHKNQINFSQSTTKKKIKMAMKMLFNLVVLMFMVSVIENERMVKVAEGKFCWIPSRTFHGICVRHKHCEETCEQEGFVTGECKGIVDRRCMCGGECGGSPPGGGGGGNPPPWGGDLTPPEGGNTPPEGGDTPPGPGGDFTPPEIQPPLEGGVAGFPPDEGLLDNNQ